MLRGKLLPWNLSYSTSTTNRPSGVWALACMYVLITDRWWGSVCFKYRSQCLLPAWWFQLATLACSAIWSILREAASRGSSALADILVTLCERTSSQYFALLYVRAWNNDHSHKVRDRSYIGFRFPLWIQSLITLPPGGVRSIVTSVCLSVGLSARISRKTRDRTAIFCTWLWLGSHVAALWYVSYFRFWGWCQFFA